MKPYTDSTLFCIAGMQQHLTKFSDLTRKGTLANVQSCLRLDDLEEIGDGTHHLYFNMLGLFSFRELTVPETISLWMSYLDRIGLKPDYVTVHPDCREWESYHTVPVREDLGCTWTDGTQTGYCTEFYINDIEIGNIVNPLGTCIDVGFGLERLALVLGGTPPTKESVLLETVVRIIDSGYEPGNKRQGYVLRRLLRLMVKSGVGLDHPFWYDEKVRQLRCKEKHERLKHRHPDKPPEWWWDTHGIDLTLL